MCSEITREKKPQEYNKWGQMFKKNMESSVVMKKWTGRSKMPKWEPMIIPGGESDGEGGDGEEVVKSSSASVASSLDSKTKSTAARPLDLE